MSQSSTLPTTPRGLSRLLLRNTFLSLNPKEICGFRFSGEILVYVYLFVCMVICTIPSGSPNPLSCAYFWAFPVLFSCVCVVTVTRIYLFYFLFVIVVRSNVRLDIKWPDNLLGSHFKNAPGCNKILIWDKGMILLNFLYLLLLINKIITK